MIVTTQLTSLIKSLMAGRLPPQPKVAAPRTAGRPGIARQLAVGILSCPVAIGVWAALVTLLNFIFPDARVQPQTGNLANTAFVVGPIFALPALAFAAPRLRSYRTCICFGSLMPFIYVYIVCATSGP